MRVVLLQLCNSANTSNSIGKVPTLSWAACLGLVEFQLTNSWIQGFTVTSVNPGIGDLYYKKKTNTQLASSGLQFSSTSALLPKATSRKLVSKMTAIFIHIVCHSTILCILDNHARERDPLRVSCIFQPYF